MRLFPSLIAAVLALALVACAPEAEPTPAETSGATPAATPSATVASIPTAAPTATPVPLSLEPPAESSDVAIAFTVTPQIPAEGAGQLLVTVTNLGDETISEIVLRWPTALGEQLYLAPFTPSADRMLNPLVQTWTKWVEGPGTRGEPAGTISLGYGPILADTTLEIPIVAERRAGGAVEFDLQFLDGELLLQTAEGEPAQTRVQIPTP